MPLLLFTGAAALFILLLARQDRAQRVLNVPFAPNGPATHYDPLKNNYASDVSFLENVFSTLTEYSPEGEVVSGLAIKFEWAGPEARFYFRPGITTVDGFRIDAYDAEASLKRSFIRGGAKYGFMRSLLCGAAELKKLDDACPGLKVLENGKVLSMRFDSRKTFLFPMLASVYFSVIPRRSVDPVTLDITDFRNTSGPYYVDKDSAKGDIWLKPNATHYRYSPEMPQSVRLFPIREFGNDYLLNLMSSGEGDYLLFDIARYPDVKMAYAAKNPGFRLHLTHPIRGLYVVFTRRGLRRLTIDERLLIGKKLRASFARIHPGYYAPDQIFAMEGGLTSAQRGVLRDRMNSVPEAGVIKKRVVAWRLFNYFGKEKEDILKWIPGVVSLGSEGLPGFVDYSKTGLEEPDFYIAGSDIGLQEDIGLLSYFLDLEFFDMRPGDKEAWLERYVECGTKKERMEMLQGLQYSTLLNAAVVPVALHPYAALIRDGWDFKLPKLNASNPVWRLERR